MNAKVRKKGIEGWSVNFHFTSAWILLSLGLKKTVRNLMLEKFMLSEREKVFFKNHWGKTPMMTPSRAESFTEE
jgi:hypothetical protein